MRNRAREQRRFDDADALRNRLVELGVEVHDSPNGTRWSFREPPE
jgi:cysteinyl-tRNA synthetase